VTADAQECAAVARRLGVPSVEVLSCRYQLTQGDRGVVLARGWLTARLHQRSVISAEIFEDVLAEEFSLRFIPRAQFREDEPLDLDETDEVAYDGDRIDLGETTTEQFALLLDPYPKLPGEALEQGVDEVPPEQEAAGEAEKPNPFAALEHFRGGKK